MSGGGVSCCCELELELGLGIGLEIGIGIDSRSCPVQLISLLLSPVPWCSPSPWECEEFRELLLPMPIPTVGAGVQNEVEEEGEDRGRCNT